MTSTFAKPPVSRRALLNHTALVAIAAGLALGASVSHAAIVDSGPISIAVPNNIDGVYLNVVTGATGTSGGGTAGWDINLYATGGGLTFFWPSSPANSSGGVATAEPLYLPQPVGSVISVASFFSAASGGAGAAPFANFRVTGTNNLGIRFFNETTSAINYGYITIETTAASGFPATIQRIVYGNAGEAVTVTSGAVDTAPTLTYDPTTAAGVTFPGGPAGAVNATINITSAGAVGAGQTAVTGCAITGAGAGSFGAVTTTPAGGVFNTVTTAGSINLSCTRGASEATASLSCTETATPTVAGSPFTRVWALTCPAETAVAPVAAVAATTLTAGSGSVTPTIVSPAQGAGSTLFECSIPATAPSNFAITSNANQTLTAAAPLAIGLSCVPQAAETTATLTCAQTATPGPNPPDATATITCPAAPAAAPELVYSPTQAAGVTFPSGPAGAANATINITSSGAVGIGQTAVTDCAITGAGAASFGPVTTTPANGIFNTATTIGSIELSCTRGASAATASLACTETATPTVPGSPFTRTWALTCPAETAVAPVGAVAPTTLTAGSGSVTPTIVSPAQGAGSTLFECSIPASAPSNFAITSNATQTLTAAAPLDIGMSCVPQAAVTTATLTCTQTATPGPNPADATATITCPAATATVTPGIASGTTVALLSYTLPTSSSTATLSFTSTGNASVLSCTTVGAGFSVAPNPLNLATGVPGSVTVTYTGTTPGTYLGTLTCTSNTTGGPFSYPLSVNVAAVAVMVPTMNFVGMLLLVLSAMGLGLLSLGGVRRN
jgi:hypothetical protein